MTCSFPKELLALHVEGDLPDVDSKIATNHLLECGECRRFLEQLRERQSLVKSLRQETMSPSEFAGMRQEVLSLINNSEKTLGWAVKLERALLLGFRSHAYVFAGMAIVAIVSVSLFAQMRHTTPEVQQSVAVFEGLVFEGKDTLLRPDGYRDWVMVGSSSGTHHAGDHRIYINRSAYRKYVETRKFPEGTVMVLEAGQSEAGKELKASVKDSSRFAGGWGFFDFTDSEGRLKPRAQTLSHESGCRSCHEQRAATDHVFTQFYPVLKSAREPLSWSA